MFGRGAALEDSSTTRDGLSAFAARRGKGNAGNRRHAAWRIPDAAPVIAAILPIPAGIMLAPFVLPGRDITMRTGCSESGAYKAPGVPRYDRDLVAIRPCSISIFALSQKEISRCTRYFSPP
jgi:hypothetical protein